ncbi:MAG: tRNA-specific adenosine deaminase [Acidimicrobiia bacterium]|nr:tRNA-specific adenosine deaminase [Acidimicrobiia bacterium]
MSAALTEAKKAAEHDDVPVGAVLVDHSGEVVARAHNRREIDNDPTAHAEILVLRQRARENGSWRLFNHTLVVTLEPCAMCAGAAVNARVERVVYGAADHRAGAVWSLYNIPGDARLNHRCEIVSGILEKASVHLLTDFFADRR